MKLYPHGAPVCPKGQEQYEFYQSHNGKRRLVEYNFRDPDGVVFETYAPSLKEARARRDRWKVATGRI